MMRSFWLSCVVFAIGVAIVALPDSGSRAFSLSQRHGPSAVDIAGLVVIMIPWTYMIIYSVFKWRHVLYTLGRRMATIAIGFALAGIAVMGVSLARDTNTWWLGALMALAGESAWIIAAFRRN